MPSVFKYNGNEIIDSSGKVTTSAFPAGTVLKTAFTPNHTPVYNNSFSIGTEIELMSADAFTTTGSNKVLIHIEGYVGLSNNIGFILKRGTTVTGSTTASTGTYVHEDFFFGSDNHFYSASNDIYSMLGFSYTHLDSPGAGTHTYKLFCRSIGATGEIIWNRASYAADYGVGVPSFTLMEIKA